MSEFRRRLMMMQRTGGGFPAVLQKCEYITTDGEAYINARYKPIGYTYVRTKLGGARYVGSSSFLGCRTSQTSKQFTLFRPAEDNLIRADYAATGHRVSVRGDISDIILQFGFNYSNEGKNDVGVLITDFNGNQIQKVRFHVSPIAFSCDYDLYIFSYNNAGSRSKAADGLSVYELFFRENDIEIFNFVPCYVKQGKTFTDIKGNTCPAGTIGMYDTINGDFYTNDGTGTFTKGADI